MLIPHDAMLQRIFFGENDPYEGQPLCEAIVLAARKAAFARATVLRGSMSYGHSSRLHTIKISQLSRDLPVGGGLVTLQRVQVRQYGPNGQHA